MSDVNMPADADANKVDTDDNGVPETADEKRDSDIAGDGEIKFFDCTITKLVPRKDEETGKTEWIEVLSDNLYPGEKLKRDVEEEKAKEKAERDQKDAEDSADDDQRRNAPDPNNQR